MILIKFIQTDLLAFILQQALCMVKD
jgi:hypothetical protein